MKHLERLLLPGFFRSCRLRRGTADPEPVEPGITGTTTPNPPPRARQSSAQRPARGTAKPADSLLPQADGVRPPLYVEDVGQLVLVRAGSRRKGDSEHRLQKNMLQGQVETRRASTRARCFPRAGAASAVPAAAAPTTAPAHLCPPAPPAAPGPRTVVFPGSSRGTTRWGSTGEPAERPGVLSPGSGARAPRDPRTHTAAAPAAAAPSAAPSPRLTAPFNSPTTRLTAPPARESRGGPEHCTKPQLYCSFSHGVGNSPLPEPGAVQGAERGVTASPQQRAQGQAHTYKGKSVVISLFSTCKIPAVSFPRIAAPRRHPAGMAHAQYKTSSSKRHRFQHSLGSIQ